MLAALRSLSAAATSLANALEDTPRSATPNSAVAAAKLQDPAEPSASL
jgi:hypothetical protein